jgi:hypothetical protein
MVKRYRLMPVDLLGRERPSMVTYGEECDGCGGIIPADAAHRHNGACVIDLRAEIDELREKLDELGDAVAAIPSRSTK